TARRRARPAGPRDAPGSPGRSRPTRPRSRRAPRRAARAPTRERAGPRRGRSPRRPRGRRRAGGPAVRRRAPPAAGPGSTSRHATGDVLGEPLAQLGAEVLAGHRELDDGLDVVEAVAGVVAPAPEDHAVHPRAL